MDNKDYEILHIDEFGNLRDSHSDQRVKKRSILPIIACFCLLLAALAWYFTQGKIKTVDKVITNVSSHEKSGPVETQVVIMKSGKTYYAKEVQTDGDHLKIFNKDGSIDNVSRKDIMQITKAVIED